MKRYFAPIDQADLASIILTAFSHYDRYDEEEWRKDNKVTNWTHFVKAISKWGYRIPWRNLTPKIEADLKKCDFDTENVDCEKGYDDTKKIAGFQTLSSGFTFLGISAGGDWESPVFFIIYYDGENLRAYIPLSGNPWNTDEKQAYGNNESDDSNAKKRFNVDSYTEAHANADLILKEIEEHIVPKSTGNKP